MTPEACQRAVARILEQCLGVHKAEGSRREHFAYKQAYREVFKIIDEERSREADAGTIKETDGTERSSDLADSG